MSIKTLTLSGLIFLVLVAGAFAQPPLLGAIFQGSTENVTLVVASGHTELTGDVYVTVMAGSNPTLVGTIRLGYNVHFTSPLDGSIGTPVVIGTGGLATAAINVLTSNPAAGMLVVTVPAGGVAGDYIRVHGVRLDVAGSPKPAYTVTLGSTGNAIFNGQVTAPVTDGSAAGLKYDKTVGVDVNAITPVGGTAAIWLEEGFNNAFGLTSWTEPTQTISQMIKITLSAAPPPGVTIAFPGTATSDGTAAWARANAAGVVSNTPRIIDSASTNLSVYYRLTANNNPTMPERFMLNVAIGITAEAADLPLPPGVITYTATLAPNQPAFNQDGTVIDLEIPRYALSEVGPVTLIQISGDSAKKRRGQLISQ